MSGEYLQHVSASPRSLFPGILVRFLGNSSACFRRYLRCVFIEVLIVFWGDQSSALEGEAHQILVVVATGFRGRMQQFFFVGASKIWEEK